MKSRIAAVLTFSFFAPMALAAAPTSCPFSAGELKSALNSEFKEGKVGFESDFGTGKSLSCRYEGKNMSLVVKQTVMKDPAQTRGWEAGLAGKKEKVANDPDGALWQVDQGDNTSPNLHYVRNGDIVELRVMGVGKSNAQFEPLQKKLPTLRRLP